MSKSLNETLAGMLHEAGVVVNAIVVMEVGYVGKEHTEIRYLHTRPMTDIAAKGLAAMAQDFADRQVWPQGKLGNYE